MSFFGLPSDPGIIGEHLETQQSKFPHTRALLSTITRLYKSTDNGDSDAETDDFARVPAAMVNKVADMLSSEQEDELKVFLKSSYGIDDETVR
jgi:crotonobetainyl-CoA:carnitine CoA-transferase CaiB-like acyl-CoA transferase